MYEILEIFQNAAYSHILFTGLQSLPMNSQVEVTLGLSKQRVGNHTNGIIIGFGEFTVFSRSNKSPTRIRHFNKSITSVHSPFFLKCV